MTAMHSWLIFTRHIPIFIPPLELGMDVQNIFGSLALDSSEFYTASLQKETQKIILGYSANEKKDPF